MGCTSNPETQLARARSKAIDRTLKKDKEKNLKELKILLLGTGESGKSTLIKQMKIFHGRGFSNAEREQFRAVVFRNCLLSIKALLHATELFSIPIERSLEDAAYALLDTPEESFLDLRPYHQLFKQLWADPGIQQCYAKRNLFQLSDSTSYFLSSLDRLAAPDYVPTDDDILRAREATTGIHEYMFNVKRSGKTAVLRMLDVGGQRSERRKWIHCFEHVTSIIFIAAASEYDQTLAEADDTNRLQESLALFEQIVQYQWFKDTSFILFLNKEDLLQEKIPRSPISKHFPSFSGDTKNVEQVKKFIKELYMACLGKKNLAFLHFTTAVDTENIHRVFDACVNVLISDNLTPYV